MLSNNRITAPMVEQVLNVFIPEIPSLPDVSLQEEFMQFRDRAKKQQISIRGSVIEICCDYEAIAMILCDRFIQDNSVFLRWGVEEIHILFGDRPPTKIYVN